MIRTTAIKVKQIISTTISDIDINAYIAGASAIVDHVLGDDVILSSTLKEEIERWLTAHLIAATRERQAKEEGAGGAYIKYSGSSDSLGLEATSYGQQVLAMDVTGKMRALTKSKQASLYAVPSFTS